ncbi:DUF3105 domain-containing protein [Streptomyces sp. L2]|uniref:DUF3105 domain-containing protein n=1 Tax=Streptomyces sp. L2 TaxID=2162665 RepID=UPI001F50A5E9|nr:DUF3105 domain-containing protein [Streptomyces sp. L2]
MAASVSAGFMFAVSADASAGELAPRTHSLQPPQERHGHAQITLRHESGSDHAAGDSGTTGWSVSADGVKTWLGPLARNHVTGTVTYPTDPPVGGPHNPVWLDCNGEVYTEPVRNENAVHSLEHGAVWVTYNSKASKADVTALAAKVRKTPYTMMSPYEHQKDPIMLTAWGHQRTVTSASDPNVETFFAAYAQGRQTPEPGAPCTGGTMK